jgi:hypothetical protein
MAASGIGGRSSEWPTLGRIAADRSLLNECPLSAATARKPPGRLPPTPDIDPPHLALATVADLSHAGVMEKTGLEILGSPLFYDRRAADKLIRRIPSDVTRFLAKARKADPEADEAQLQEAIHSAFAIKPMAVGSLTAIRIESFERNFLNEYRCWTSGYLHEAEVGYTGGKLFWRLKALEPTKFDYRGVIGPATVRLRTFISEEAYDFFRNDAKKAVAYAREMMELTARSQQMIVDRARKAVDATLSELVLT